MDTLKQFLDAIDTPGGHIVVCALLGLIGAGLSIRGHEMAAEPLLGFLAASALAMRGTGKANS